MNILVGSTGFVGSNILDGGGQIDLACHSTNVDQAFGKKPDILVYAGLRAEKYLANLNPDADLQLIKQAEENIYRIAPKKLVLISTIDVLKEPFGKEEDVQIDIEGLQPYGLNRYQLEQWVRDQYPDALIIRLPGIYGMNIKKNFIYDLINIIPAMISEEKFQELSVKYSGLKKYYVLQPNGFYKCIKFENKKEKEKLKKEFLQLGFTALNFTDSRNVYQFYPLSRLWKDILIALDNDLTLVHMAVEPISAGELYFYLTGKSFINEITGKPVYYDFRTMYASLFGGKEEYLIKKSEALEDIKKFIKTETERQ